MKIYGHMVVGNEADQYLQSSLMHARNFIDFLHVYDDLSTDDSLEIAATQADAIGVRPESAASFMEHEGKFRSAAYKDFVAKSGIKDGEWVLVFDADEFVVGTNNEWNPRSGLIQLAEFAENSGHVAAQMPRGEIWDITGLKPKVRTDGFWGERVTRFFRHQSGWKWSHKPMGCGSCPTYTAKSAFYTAATCSMLHFGYAEEEDRVAKFNRYNSMDKHGHNPKHIQSILKKPTLAETRGAIPKFWKGVR